MAPLTIPRYFSIIQAVPWFFVYFFGVIVAPTFATTAVQLTWDESPNSNPVGYKVYMGTSSGSYPTMKDAGLTQMFLFKNLTDGKKYYFALTAYHQMGNESVPSAEVYAHIPDHTPPTTPGQPTVVSSSDSQISLQWAASTDNVGVTAYDVARNSVVIGQSQTNAFTDKTFTPDQTYHYSVRARDAHDNLSTWSPALQVSTPQTSTQLTVSTSGDGMITSSRSGIHCPQHNCTGKYPPGTVVVLRARPGKGSSFDGWSGGCTGTELCTITLTEDMTATATFSKGLGRVRNR